MYNLLFATSNAHKVEEIKQFFAESPVNIVSLLDYPDIPEAPEPFETFEENAEAKATFIFQRTGVTVISDDSGLEVEALHGRPGVFSKRYSAEGTAEANNEKLLREMENQDNRSAQFVCVLAIHTGEETRFIRGVCKGSIADRLSGKGGFGYDPLFLPDEYPGRSMADLSMAEKNLISHRGRALEQLKQQLSTFK